MLLSLGGSVFGAQIAPPQISTVQVFVRDAAGHPIPAAAIYARDRSAERYIGITGTDGRTTVEAPQGTPIFARWKGGQSQVQVADGGTVDLRFGLQTIDTIVARLPLGSLQTNTTSVAAIISGGVTDALDFVPNYRSQDEGGSGSLALNGTPLTLPPGQGSHFTVPSDLIASFTPDQADDGSITPNLHLTSPTGTPQQQLSLLTGSQGAEALKGTLTGPGYAFVVSDRLDEGQLDGQTFTDQSGSTYDHSANEHELSGSADVEFRLGGAHVSAVALADDRRNAGLSFVDPGDVVEGVGPGNTERTNMLDGYIRAAQTRGRDGWTALHVAYGGTDADDDLNAMSEGTPIPSYTGFGYSGRYDMFNFTRRFGQNSATISLSNTATIADSYARPYETVSTSSGTTASFSYNRTGRSSSVTARLSSARETGPFTAAHVNASIEGSRWTNATHLNWAAYTAQTQTIETYYAQALRLAVPGAADYDCDSHAALASGPSDATPVAPHSTGVTAAITRRVRATDLTFGGFYDATRDALVIAGQAGGMALPPGYLAAIDQQYASLCGGAPLTAADLYLMHYVTVPLRVDKEWYASSNTSLGANFNLALAYETYAATAYGVPAFPSGATSTLIDDAQIWNVPLHRASAILSYHTTAITAGIGTAYVGANNSAHLPAYAITSAGIRLSTVNGAIVMSIQNLFNEDAGRFTSPALATPTATTAGAMQFLGVPIARTWSIRYEVRTGRVAAR